MLDFIFVSSQFIFRRAHGKFSGLNFSQDHFRGLVLVCPAAFRHIAEIAYVAALEVDHHVFFLIYCQSHTEAVALVLFRGIFAHPGSGTAILGVVVVGGAAADAVSAGGLPHRIGLVASVIAVPIQAPFPDVAVHVVEAPGIREIRAHDGMLRIAALAVVAVIIITSELVHVPVSVNVGDVGTVVPGRCRSGPAGELPLRFRGKVEISPRLRAEFAHKGILVDLAVGGPAFAFASPSYGVVIDILRRSRFADVIGRIGAGNKLILLLGGLEDADVKILGEGDFVLDFVLPAAQFILGRAHSEFSSLDFPQDQFYGFVSV